MNTVSISIASIHKKTRDRINQYLSLSDKQSLSIGLYANGQAYIVNQDRDEKELSYDIGSVSKTVTGHLILKLCDDGIIDINKPVSEYLELKEGDYPTIYELLTHTGGFSRFTPVEITIPTHLFQRYSYRNPYEKVKKSDVFQSLARRRHRSASSKYRYSDFSYAVLAQIAEKVTNTHFIDLLTEFMKDELQLESTSVIREIQEPKAVLNGKVVPYWKRDADNPYIAAGSLKSNIFDMLRYISIQIESDKKYITDGHIVCPNSFTEGKRTGTTLCWHTYRSSGQLWHVGGVGTFRASVIFNRNSRKGVVLLGNTRGIKSANVHHITKMIYKDLKRNKVKL